MRWWVDHVGVGVCGGGWIGNVRLVGNKGVVGNKGWVMRGWV